MAIKKKDFKSIKSKFSKQAKFKSDKFLDLEILSLEDRFNRSRDGTHQYVLRTF